MAIRILLADDHLIVREGLRSLLEQNPEIRVVAETDNGRDAVLLTGNHSPDVAIIDLSMPLMNGIEASRQINAEFSATKVLLLSMHANRRLIIEAMKAGASGYVLKDCAAEELVKAIDMLMSGESYLSPKVNRLLNGGTGSRQSGAAGFSDETLTSREHEVLRQIAEGCNTKEIAFNLNVSIKTIETHRLNIMHKLNMSGVAELTRYAIREGIVRIS